MEGRVSIFGIFGTDNLISRLVDSCIPSLTIYPNPASRDFQVASEDDQGAEALRIKSSRIPSVVRKLSLIESL